MKFRLSALALVLAATCPVFAQHDAKPGDAKQPPAAPAPKAPADKDAQPAAGQDDMMKMMEEMAKPTKEHEALKVMAGTWKADITHWMDPSAPPGKATGTMVNTLIHGGRYVHHEFKGEFMGAQFSGSGDFGFNKVTGKYEGTWMDNFGTAIMNSVGTYDEATKTYTSTAEFDMPMAPGGPVAKIKQRETIKIDSNDKHTMTMYHTMAGVPEMKVMEIVYTRAGDAMKKAGDDAAKKINDAAGKAKDLVRPGK